MCAYDYCKAPAETLVTFSDYRGKAYSAHPACIIAATIDDSYGCAPSWHAYAPKADAQALALAWATYLEDAPLSA